MNVDIVMMVAILALGVGLVPQVVKNFRTKTCGIVFSTALVNSISLWVLVWCFFMLGKWFSCGGSVFQGALWTVMLVQWFAYRRKVGCRDCTHRLPLWWRMASICSITGKEHGRSFMCGRFTERGGK